MRATTYGLPLNPVAVALGSLHFLNIGAILASARL
jgi:hypothetical protein